MDYIVSDLSGFQLQNSWVTWCPTLCLVMCLRKQIQGFCGSCEEALLWYQKREVWAKVIDSTETEWANVLMDQAFKLNASSTSIRDSLCSLVISWFNILICVYGCIHVYIWVFVWVCARVLNAGMGLALYMWRWEDNLEAWTWPFILLEIESLFSFC